MNLVLDNWTYIDYNNFLSYLYSLKDEKYQQFHYRLLKNDKINLIGVRTPTLHKIAKEIAKGNYLSFIKLNKLNTYEEVTIYGLIIGYLKIDFQELLNLLNNFIPNINNWATCDLTCSNLKMFAKNQKIGFKYIQKLVADKNPWIKRFGIVLLLNYYLNDNYIDLVLTLITDINDTNYYVEMALAWFLSTAYIKYQDKVLNLLKSDKISKNIIKITIEKVNESYRVNEENKEKLKILLKK